MACALAASLAGSSPSTAALAPASADASATTLELETKALALEDRGDLRGAAKLWQALAVRAEDGEVRVMAAFRAQRARRELGAATGSLAEFCAAARIIEWTLAREDLPAEARADFEAFAREVDVEVDLAARGRRGGCSAMEGEATTTTTAMAGATEAAGAAVASGARAPRKATSPARPFVIAGAATASAGLALVGVMGYGLAIDHAEAQAVYELAAKNEQMGLTPAEATDLDEAVARGRAGARLALGSGIAAGVVGLVGVGLLAHGGRLARAERRAERLTVTPRIGGGVFGLSLGGRF